MKNIIWYSYILGVAFTICALSVDEMHKVEDAEWDRLGFRPPASHSNSSCSDVSSFRERLICFAFIPYAQRMGKWEQLIPRFEQAFAFYTDEHERHSKAAGSVCIPFWMNRIWSVYCALDCDTDLYTDTFPMCRYRMRLCGAVTLGFMISCSRALVESHGDYKVAPINARRYDELMDAFLLWMDWPVDRLFFAIALAWSGLPVVRPPYIHCDECHRMYSTVPSATNRTAFV